ncbi:uncharacterized protein TRAVEDRAFT_22936 [Trametes versicolor FP-101664 SS1]|uniref:uncharacterized protein n=1 Tax=Trametes versicolor (strain FP-101664) TaxID=717944 RepID=UPI0004621960|nr:uncharacterized protein TRAVEDRAFT_22936 [Trametes versicolor FP-101664 SS1]EIW55174.1 hypothetical protein TRAVEDRAFT_22936 [Trametes versicolor FP-101664 SS1]
MGDVPALFVLGLTCPVRYLVVNGPYSAHDTSKLADILRDTTPTHLNMSSNLHHGDDFLTHLFPPEVAPQLTHLVLLLKYRNDQWRNEQSIDIVKNMQWNAVLGKIIDSIRALRLTHFRLFVHYDIDLEENVYYGPYSKDLVLSIAELDHAHVAAQLMDAVPSLEHVVVSSGGQFEAFPDERHSKRGRWFAHSAWKRVSGGPPEKLDEDVMERMLREQDLGLSHRDEFQLGIQDTWAAEETTPWPLPD